MVQISKLSKDEIKSTGFNNKAIASKFMKTVLNKKARDFKKKEDLIKTLTKEYKKMADFGIDLNETSKIDRTIKKIEKKTKNVKEEYDNFLVKNMEDEAVQEMQIEEYLKQEDYKIPRNKNYKDNSKKLKQLYYFKWLGMEDILHNITDLYRQQDTAFKFNVSLAYLLRRPKILTDENGMNSMIGYEYKYFSPQYNNRLFEYPETIDNNKTLKEDY